jgi:hypothetical protein
MSDSPPSFADRVHAMTFADTLMGRRVSGDAKFVLARHRANLRNAERFVLDDEAVRLVCHLSHERDRLSNWAFLARLPHSPMWVEFNLHTKVDEWQKMGTLQVPFDPEQVSPVVGYLLYKDGNSASRWICHEFCDLNGTPYPGLLAYVFDPEGDGMVAGSATWGSPTLSRRVGFPRVPGTISFDDGSANAETTIDPEYVLCGVFKSAGSRGDPRIVSPDWFVQRASAIVEPFWDATKPDLLNEIVLKEVREQAGIMRWLMTMLAAINALPRDVHPVATRTGRRAVGMRELPYLRHSNLAIRLPRDNRVVWARRSLDRDAKAARRLAWHPVMSHWRVIERGKSTHLCRHEPTMVEEGVGLCTRCEMMIRWIEVPNGRGDPSIGVVEHVHRVAARKTGNVVA